MAAGQFRKVWCHSEPSTSKLPPARLHRESGRSLMAKKKRHSDAEIVAKLAQADLLSKEGKTQAEIARTLGVSVMTFHRWRKAQPQHSVTIPNTPRGAEGRSGSESSALIAELRL